ncbi:molybdopterin-binding protein [Gemmobacter fulvus]|uniref:Molybdopterin-binding protein n=1 Tax=Gemmobacter fulvus TaxID=2840474 RepID=A0A975S137_9RHOB|nr:molybdopterin-binding protein [Gemmobacter fulvus]MBT9243878.1 molybdopterin-binding protein [Gemmobacter fulvus]QWK90799.1 molybdopterin-binding protein [Gemmobacter fulvus]
MRFGSVPLAEAEGAILAHRIDTPQGVIAKGKLLGPEDLARLAAAGRTEVIVARPDPGELGEDAAAARLAAALAPDPAALGLRLTGAATGRVNLYATGPGLLLVDVPRIHALNAVHPMITLATLAPFARVEARSMLATAKIIAYAVPEAALARACAQAAGALRVAAPVIRRATLIETTLSDEAPAPKGREALATRLRRLGAGLEARVLVPHRAEPLAAALAQATGEVIFILTASATSDPADVGPAALIAAGGRLIRFGMPVDPGNLLFLGDLNGRPVIGLPGCARSPALNGADWVLERVICGQTVGADDIAAMGVGGLLKEIAARGRLREAPDAPPE